MGSKKASKLVVAALVASGITLAGCGGGGGGGKVAYVKSRLGACMTGSGTSPDAFTWQDLGRGKDSDGNPADGVTFTAKDGSEPPITVNVAVSNPKDAIYWSSTPPAEVENMLQPCMGSPS
jgi:hypothetical protein